MKQFKHNFTRKTTVIIPQRRLLKFSATKLLFLHFRLGIDREPSQIKPLTVHHRPTEQPTDHIDHQPSRSGSSCRV